MLINSKLSCSYLFEIIHFSYLEKELEIMKRTGFWTRVLDLNSRFLTNWHENFGRLFNPHKQSLIK